MDTEAEPLLVPEEVQRVAPVTQVRPAEIFLKWLTDIEFRPRKKYRLESPSGVLTTSSGFSFHIGTGTELVNHHVQAMAAVQEELIIVTNYWGKSKSSTIITGLLQALSDRGRTSGPGTTRDIAKKIRIRICLYFPSRGLVESFTWPSTGKILSPEEWSAALALPPPEELPGLDVHVKAVIKPAIKAAHPQSHPQFFILDRSIVLFTSYNFNTPMWLEAVICLHGPIVDNFVYFWKTHWCHEKDDPAWILPEFDSREPMQDLIAGYSRDSELNPRGRALLVECTKPTSSTILFLPSRRKRKLYRLIPGLDHGPLPKAPFNKFFMYAILNVRNYIYHQTPVMMDHHMKARLGEALRRGIDVTVVTNERVTVTKDSIKSEDFKDSPLKQLCKHHRSELDRRPHGLGILRVVLYRSAHRDMPRAMNINVTVLDRDVVIFGTGNLLFQDSAAGHEMGVAIASFRLARFVEDGMLGLGNRYTEVCYDANQLR